MKREDGEVVPPPPPPPPLCGPAPSGSVRGSFDGFKSGREREQTKPKEERGNEGREEGEGW